ncbi:hypothetical protein [Haloarcula halophila]|uniref:hypothetical protein n=1 Tax=Haloarcula TaxID=2237 RepID=UPI0023E377A3|nr:hypothetical protein [Halomicroarcula sp. DFY41]
MSKTHPYPERQLPEDQIVPSMETIGPVVDQVVAIARQQLKRPISVHIETWEDQEFEVRVTHWSAPGVNTRYGYESIIQYHSDRETIRGVLIEEDTETDEREALLQMDFNPIRDPVAAKNRD